MAWPTDKASNQYTDSGQDRIADARAEINKNITNVNDILDFYDTSGPYATQGNYSKQQVFGLQTLSYDSAGDISWDVSTAQTAKATLTSGSTTIHIQNPIAGGTYILIFTASSGSDLFFENYPVKYPSGLTPSFVDSSTNVYTMIFDGTSFLVSYVLDLSTN